MTTKPSANSVRSAGSSIGLFVAIACAAAYLFYSARSLVSQYLGISTEKFDYSNLGLFLLANLNILLVMTLGFLVIRNVVKLILDRRRKILGSHLRARLVVAFVGLSLVPALLLFFVSRGIVGSVMKGWFSPQITSAVEGALAVARYHYKYLEAETLQKSKSLALDVGRLIDESNEFPSVQLRALLEEEADELRISQIDLLTVEGKSVLNLRREGLQSSLASSLSAADLSALLERLRRQGPIVRPEHTKLGDALIGMAAISTSKLDTPENAELLPALILITLPIGSQVSEELIKVTHSYDDFKELYSYRIPLASTYFLTLVIVTLLLVFAAMWVGFYLARTLSGPIQLLAEGTQEIMKGNLDIQLPEVGGDELTTLVRSFNRMTADLKHTTGELVSRRRYMETVLESVGVGVISIDPSKIVTTCNAAAGDILAIAHPDSILNKPLAEVVPTLLTEKVDALFEEFETLGTKVGMSTLSLYVLHRTKQIHITMTKLLSDENVHLGSVMLLDDLTELVQAQRMAAWQEVARRMAHEIKNPLTPVQLSAQRIQRRLLSGAYDENAALADDDREVVRECTDTIVEQVEVLRNLVNEFSRFARMPRSKPQLNNLNAIVDDAIKTFRHSYPEVQLEENLSPDLPLVSVDREQLGRVFVNLLDNAIAAIHARQDRGPWDRGEAGVIRVSSFLSEGDVVVSVSDNGTGISDEDKPKLFEPYFSTKKGGTGLGLAIVFSVVSEHHGTIAVFDEAHRGSRFEIRLPAS